MAICERLTDLIDGRTDLWRPACASAWEEAASQSIIQRGGADEDLDNHE